MRILLTTDAVGGVWRYSLTLAREWAASGIAVDLAVLGPDPVLAQQQEAAAIPGLLLHRTDLPLDWTAPDSDAVEQAATALAELADSLDATSVHLHAPALVGASTDWPVSTVAVIHSCLLTWWQAMRNEPPPSDFRWRIDLTRAGLHRATRLAAPTAAFRDAVRAAYALDRTVAAIANSRHPLPVAVPSDRPRAVFAAGRFWDEGKDIETLDRAAARLDAPVRVAGSFRGPDGAEAASTDVLRLGNLDEPGLARALANAAVFVSTARYEPFGLAVLEAAQAGLALVLSDIPSFRELWDGAAFFVRPGDADGFAQALRRALDDPAPLAAAARARAARYTPAHMAAATLDLHRSA